MRKVKKKIWEARKRNAAKEKERREEKEKYDAATAALIAAKNADTDSQVSLNLVQHLFTNKLLILLKNSAYL